MKFQDIKGTMDQRINSLKGYLNQPRIMGVNHITDELEQINRISYYTTPTIKDYPIQTQHYIEGMSIVADFVNEYNFKACRGEISAAIVHGYRMTDMDYIKSGKFNYEHLRRELGIGTYDKTLKQSSAEIQSKMADKDWAKFYQDEKNGFMD